MSGLYTSFSLAKELYDEINVFFFNSIIKCKNIWNAMGKTWVDSSQNWLSEKKILLETNFTKFFFIFKFNPIFLIIYLQNEYASAVLTDGHDDGGDEQLGSTVDEHAVPIVGRDETLKPRFCHF